MKIVYVDEFVPPSGRHNARRDDLKAFLSDKFPRHGMDEAGARAMRELFQRHFHEYTFHLDAQKPSGMYYVWGTLKAS